LAARDFAVSKKTNENWNTERGILDGLHRIREGMEQERRRLGDAAWLKKLNSDGQRLGATKPFKKGGAAA
jgi:hypothetical protein